MSNSAYRLQIQSGPESGREYPLESDSITIGRYPLADIVINEPDIAYRHALLTRSGDTYRIADLGSEAGTYVNGRRIGAEAVALTHGDVILLGARMSVAYLSRLEAQTDAEGKSSPVAQSSGIEHPTEQPASTIIMTAADSTDQKVDPLLSYSQYDPPSVGEESYSETLPFEPGDTTDLDGAARSHRAEAHHPGPLPAMPPRQKNKNGRIALIAAGCLIAFLACCCSTTLFMYYIGGDWLLNQLGYLP